MRMWTYKASVLCKVSAGVFILACSACSSKPESHALLVAELSGAINEGMRNEEAMTILYKGEFTCRPYKVVGEKILLDCTRSRGNLWPPYGCVHRVRYEYTPPNGALDKLQVFRPACTGL